MKFILGIFFPQNHLSEGQLCIQQIVRKTIFLRENCPVGGGVGGGGDCSGETFFWKSSEGRLSGIEYFCTGY